MEFGIPYVAQHWWLARAYRMGAKSVKGLKGVTAQGNTQGSIDFRQELMSQGSLQSMTTQ